MPVSAEPEIPAARRLGFLWCVRQDRVESCLIENRGNQREKPVCQFVVWRSIGKTGEEESQYCRRDPVIGMWIEPGQSPELLLNQRRTVPFHVVHRLPVQIGTAMPQLVLFLPYIVLCRW